MLKFLTTAFFAFILFSSIQANELNVWLTSANDKVIEVDRAYKSNESANVRDRRFGERLTKFRELCERQALYQYGETLVAIKLEIGPGDSYDTRLFYCSLKVILKAH